MTPKIKEILIKIREQRPFILNMTDYFPVDLVANGVRSIGALPIMNNARQEVEELLNLSKAVVINMGKLDDNFIKLCNQICKTANKFKIPIILDPVGAGATQYRTDTAIRIISNHAISIIRAYPSEIDGLLSGQVGLQNHNATNLTVMTEKAKLLSEKYKLTVVVSGKRHIVADKNRIDSFNFDSNLLQRVAGIGSLLSAIIGVFHSVEKDQYIAAKHAVEFYAHCVGPTSCDAPGPASLITRIIDKLYIKSSEALIQSL
ncbi:hydroxyethylthiazole kinase [Legionella tunisiensis]|uniref:hydroxyethylthiazole kinase n=1 Tax=Legionella tunisiensis TaxID=1034944 RepID=UPI000301A86C|nr:hydroxyethylthiazole kinase [Legionella tunisiensis]